MKCEMTKECMEVVTHIDSKGYIYCTSHGLQRQSFKRCRKMTSKELKTIESGCLVESY
jgi:hypothetical protein